MEVFAGWVLLICHSAFGLGAFSSKATHELEAFIGLMSHRGGRANPADPESGQVRVS
jgi:hypothetical protein